MKPEYPLEVGDVVQLSPSTSNPNFAHAFMQVTEVKSFGATGFVLMLDPPGGQAYYRANWSDMEYVGKAAWVMI